MEYFRRTSSVLVLERVYHLSVSTVNNRKLAGEKRGVESRAGHDSHLFTFIQ